ncbi:translation initiation factor IF-2, partial [Candidatus Woesearchaeota archaeon]|nr:translation initiation factor IF-2 [Candidatus Woesearchaeota archaeon]
MIRQPIVTIMGHVDHGKTSLLDKIRGSAIAAKEAGGITQAIGASIIPLATLKKICGQLLEKLQLKFTIPGLLFIDTPGHAAFINLRKRGGNLADIAILVISINEGLKPQTLECIDILKTYKTPFIIAVNKIDLIEGWKPCEKSVLQTITVQQQKTQQLFETKMYEIVGKMYELGFEAERFDRVGDYTKQIALVPISAKTGEGIPELLMVLTGLAQKYLEKNLEINAKAPAKGTIIEIKEEKGLGVTADAIIYDGTLNVNDTIIVGSMEEPITTKIKALLLPTALFDTRDTKTKFGHTKTVTAATGVRIVAPELEKTVSGMPIISAQKNIEQAQQQIRAEVQSVTLSTEQKGIIIKADSLGSLEALHYLLKEKKIPVNKTSVGAITKKDISDAEANAEKEPLTAVILAFNIPQPQTIPQTIKIISHNVIYQLIEDYEKWLAAKKQSIEMGKLDVLIKPAKIQLLKGYIFRQSNPAVVGIEVMAGTLKTGTPLMKQDGQQLTTAKDIQHEQEHLDKLEKGKRAAISLPNVVIGRQLKEGDILYSLIPESHFKIFKEHKQY